MFSLIRQFIRTLLLCGLFVAAAGLLCLTNGLSPWATLMVCLIVFLLTAVFEIRRIQSLLMSSLKRLSDEIHRLTYGENLDSSQSPLMDELAPLYSAINQMSSQLNSRIELISRQKSQLDAVLSSMVEGVVAIDTEERVLSMNDAARSVLQVEDSDKPDQKIDQLINNSDFQNLAKQVLTSRHPIQAEVVIPGDVESFLQTNGTPLRDPLGRPLGALLVFHDITRLRKLENMRRDFVANVSHELKTPITSIKGFVETLLDGALNNPKDSKRFLEIIAKQSDRLTSIIEDLLSLSRLEQDGSEELVGFERVPARDLIDRAIQTCQIKAQEKSISFEIECKSDHFAQGNAHLLEQAVVNLLSNALKYSPEKSKIVLKTESTASNLTISVQDFGQGIPKKHLPRLFERFYRVDKARSRNLGGTGLGLAIVKHIAQVHRGFVSVESEPGKGSIFRFVVPVFHPGDSSFRAEVEATKQANR